MTYARIEDGEVAEFPLTSKQVRQAFYPSTIPAQLEKFHEVIAQRGYVPVTTQERPAFDPTKNATLQAPALVGNAWVRQWRQTDATAEQIAERLTQRKAEVWGRVKAIRDQHENGGVAVPNIGTFQTDDRSKIKISGAVTMALIAQANNQQFSESFTLADNTEAELDGPAMIAVGITVGRHVSACHARSKDLRAQINAAETVEALNAIDIEAGWP